jgi:23S rRNA (cytidine1920-2'-O)/16S rRNA (cytidine1409-2'-O)-methyltransferase
LPRVPDLAVIDVSFISLVKILPAILGTLAERHDVLALIKPQFEVGRERVGRGGVVRRRDHRREAIAAVAAGASAFGESVMGLYPSSLRGPKGNSETFIWLAEGGREGAIVDAQRLRELIESVEPDEQPGRAALPASGDRAQAERAGER